MSVTRVNSLKIKSFRRFQDITIPFGHRITIIAGQNGTSKSTLLGMLAQPFSFGVLRGKTAKSPDSSSYTENYHKLRLHEYKDLAGNPFMYDCDDVFRLSKEFDFGKNYEYETILEFPENASINLKNSSLLTKSRNRTNNGGISGMRFVTGPGASHESGEGNFPHPVLYLGLNRLWPLAVTKKCTFSAHILSESDQKWYVNNYNKILCLDEHSNKAKFMDTREKRRFITPQSTTYDGESCSAGQDNLSQILTAILSFRTLKGRLKERYQGGMLLVDEIDATLHTFAQVELLHLLHEISSELNLQIVATSHSLCTLGMAFKPTLRDSIELLHLVNRDGKIETQEFSSFQEIRDHLKVESTITEKKKPGKVSVLFEDEEARLLFQQICGSKLRNFIHCANTTTIGGGQLKNAAQMSKAIPEMRDLILIPDGDMSDKWKKEHLNNLLPLPGGERPETLAYKHLYNMSDSDPFWKKCSSTYTRQVAITKVGGVSEKVGDDKEWVKKWYKGQCAHWGKGKHRVFKSWVHGHRRECLAFWEKFYKLLRERYSGEIPQHLLDGVAAVFDGG